MFDQGLGVTRMGRMWLVAAALGAAAVVGSSAARADGYPPFYGYSGYFGGPTTYFTPESDVQQATARQVDGFDTRTYYRGGPFWTYSVKGGERTYRERSSRRRRAAVLRRRG